MKKEFSCIESTVDIEIGMEYVVRLWINQEKVPTSYVSEIRLTNKIRNYFFTKHPKRAEAVKYLAKIEGINAFQIQEIDRGQGKGLTKYGTVVYTVGFEKDSHG